MTTPRFLRLMSKTSRQLAASLCMELPDGHTVTFAEPKRSDAQNAMMWSRLGELSKQLRWDGETLTPAEWKDLLTACLRKQKVVRGIEGGLVFLGARTSQMSVGEMNDLLTLMEAFAAERGVEFRDQVEAFA